MNEWEYLALQSYNELKKIERKKTKEEKRNEESLGRIHRSSEALSARIENIERRREDMMRILKLPKYRDI